MEPFEKVMLVLLQRDRGEKRERLRKRERERGRSFIENKEERSKIFGFSKKLKVFIQKTKFMEISAQKMSPKNIF